MIGRRHIWEWGAFNLVRASAYRECGGYEALRLTAWMISGSDFCYAVRENGLAASLVATDVECHWGTTMRGPIQVMEKNYFAAIDFRLATALVAGLGACCSGVPLSSGRLRGLQPG